MGKVQCSKYPYSKCKHMELKRFNHCKFCVHNMYVVAVGNAIQLDNFKEFKC